MFSQTRHAPIEMNMRAAFFLLMLGLLACGHSSTTAAQTPYWEEGLFEDKTPKALRQQAAVWQALLTKLDTKLQEGEVEATELQWLKTHLAHAWNAQEKAGLPTTLQARAQAFLEKLETWTPPNADKTWVWPIWPVELSSPFGFRIHPLRGGKRFHPGVDLKAMAREEVRSIQEGWVLHAGWAGGYGHMVEVLHPGGRFSRYAHLAQVNVKVGEKIQRGTVVGLAGDSGETTGVHVHFELWEEGHPVDPTQHLPWAWAGLP